MRTHNPLDAARAAFAKAVTKAEVNNRMAAVVGWRKSATEVQISVPGRPNFIYVTMGGQRSVALNRAGVPLQAFLPVFVVLEHNTLVVVGRDNTNAGTLGNVPDSAYGVPSHPHALSGLSDVTLTDLADGEMLEWDSGAGKWVNVTAAGALVTSVNTQTGDVVLDADDIAETASRIWFTTAEETKLAGIEALADVTDAGNVGSSIHGAAAKTTPVDADTMPLIDSAASNALKKVTWANIKATLKTYFDTLYTAINTAVLLTGNQTVAGVKTFSNGINLGNTTLTTFIQGAHTPLIGGSVTNPTINPYTAQSGNYQRIGDWVHIQMSVTVGTITAAGSGNITVNLPIAAAGFDLLTVSVAGVNLPGVPATVVGVTIGGTTNVILSCVNDTAATVTVQHTALANGNTITIGGCYRV